MSADLHIHTTASDGYFKPAEAVQHAVDQGLRAMALTDHDNVDGISAAQESAGARMEVIPGIELSSSIESRDIHILGYFIDTDSAVLLEHLARCRGERVERAERMVAKLNRYGVPISMEMVLEQSGLGSVGRPHIADAVVKAGYARTTGEVFRDYIGYGGVAYEEKLRVTPEEAIRIIHEANGLAFLAHPTLQLNEKYLYQILKAGLDGIETIHPFVSDPAHTYYKRIASQHELLECGGSDSHGRGDIPIGCRTIPYAWVERMKERMNSRLAAKALRE